MTTSDPDAPHAPDRSEAGGDSDETIEDGRREVDRERAERRGLHDRTRQHARGTGQARAGLDRERARDDASLEDERHLVDQRRALERRRAEQDSRRQAALLAAAEGRLDDAREEEDAAGRERRQKLQAASADLTRLDAALAVVQRGCSSQPDLVAEIDVALACAGRIGRVLAAALDVEDLRGDYHDIGGSG